MSVEHLVLQKCIWHYSCECRTFGITTVSVEHLVLHTTVSVEHLVLQTVSVEHLVLHL